MPNQDDLENARATYERAWSEAKRCGDEALHALQKADLVSSESARELFLKAADKALLASENWRGSAELAREVMQEIVSGIPSR